MSIDLEEQYDKIYRYCYYKLHHREKAEDITQETFLRFLENENYRDTGKGLQYLYTIARNLCIDEFRKKPTEELHFPEVHQRNLRTPRRKRRGKDDLYADDLRRLKA